MSLLDDLCLHVQRLAVVCVLDAVINMFEVIFNMKERLNRIAHLLIVRFEI